LVKIKKTTTFAHSKFRKNAKTMSKICEVTGKKVMFGNNVSFSINKTKRRFDVNISKKRFYVPEEDRWVTLNVSSKGLKVIDKKGISEVLKASREKGYIK